MNFIEKFFIRASFHIKYNYLQMSKVTAKVSAEPGKKKNQMAAAVSGTEAIRTWDDHRIGVQALADKFKTNKDTGLTEA